MSDEKLWHRRFGHVGKEKLKVLANGNLVENFAYDSTNDIEFCESCFGGKQRRTPFENGSRQVADLLELMHSDVCVKISERSMSGAQYFLTFIDHKSRYSWTCFLKKLSIIS